jgi:apurinic endonuclease APN1
MSKKEYYYGSHIGISKHGIIGGIDEIIKYDGNFIQIFITNPKARKTTKRSDEELATIRHYAKYNKVKIVIHAPYLLNFAHEFNKNSWGITSLMDHLEICSKMGSVGVVVHSGKYLHMDKSEAIENMYQNFKYCLDNSPSSTKILLETPCGQGTELGGRLEEFRIIYNKFSEEDKKRIRICVDTCHVFAAGYDLSEPDKVKQFIKTFDTLIGWKYVDLIHLNDSKTKLNSKLDRHELLDEGNIKLKGLSVIVKFAYSSGIPLILETPGGYPIEIQIIGKIIKKSSLA